MSRSPVGCGKTGLITLLPFGTRSTPTCRRTTAAGPARPVRGVLDVNVQVQMLGEGFDHRRCPWPSISGTSAQPTGLSIDEILSALDALETIGDTVQDDAITRIA